MKSYESTAKTVEEAITAGLNVLGASIGDVDIVVLEEGSKGLFGLFGSRNAKVRLTMKETEDDLFGEISMKEEKVGWWEQAGNTVLIVHIQIRSL